MDVDEALGILGFAEGEGPADPADLKVHYQRLVKIWHPDRFAGDAETAAYASSQLARINAANGLIRKLLESGVKLRRRVQAPAGAAPAEAPRPSPPREEVPRPEPQRPEAPRTSPPRAEAPRGPAGAESVHAAAPATSESGASRFGRCAVRALVIVGVSTFFRSMGTSTPSDRNAVRATEATSTATEATSTATETRRPCAPGSTWRGAKCQCNSDTPAWSAGEGRCVAYSTVPGGMAVIPGGMVTIEGASRSTRVASFSIDVTEVTVDAYAACVRAGNCSKPNDDGRCNWGKSDRGNHPVNCVDWQQAKAFCGWAQKRLPTEQEWQRAAESAQGRTYPWGEAAPSNQLCWRPTSHDEGTCAVGSFPSGDSAQGVKDLSGNVWEWTDSCDDSSCSARVYRGGGWSSVPASSVRAANRGWLDPSSRYGYLGFRCSRSN